MAKITLSMTRLTTGTDNEMISCFNWPITKAQKLETPLYQCVPQPEKLLLPLPSQYFQCRELLATFHENHRFWPILPCYQAMFITSSFGHIWRYWQPLNVRKPLVQCNRKLMPVLLAIRSIITGRHMLTRHIVLAWPFLKIHIVCFSANFVTSFFFPKTLFCIPF